MGLVHDNKCGCGMTTTELRVITDELRLEKDGPGNGYGVG